MIVNQLAIQPAFFDPMHHPGKQAMDIVSVIRHANDADNRQLPHILCIYFGHGDVELSAQSGHKTFDDPALALERSISRDVQFQGAGSDNHRLPLDATIPGVMSVLLTTQLLGQRAFIVGEITWL